MLNFVSSSFKFVLHIVWQQNAFIDKYTFHVVSYIQLWTIGRNKYKFIGVIKYYIIVNE